jgi:hypothetical protein
MELYHKYQPVTWWIGVIETAPDEVTRVIQPLYIPNEELRDIRHETGSIDEALASMEPLGPYNKFLLMRARDGRTVLFTNTFFAAVELPTSYAAENLGVSSYTVCNVPNTISRDERSGAYGARKVEFRTADNPITEEPVFGVQVMNDAGRWCFYRSGEKRDFEDHKAYKAVRKANRFTVEMLVKYCRELGIPVYDRKWYSNKWIVIEGKLRPDEHGMSYEEAAVKLRIKQDVQQNQL